MIYIHYGTSHYDPSRFKPISNERVLNKPAGGLWASPKVCEYGWYDWCHDEMFWLDKFDKYFLFKLTEDSKKIIIDSNAALNKVYDMGYYFIDPVVRDRRLDFEKLYADGYDAVEMVLNNETYWSLYGWDCDSVVILNPNCIIEISEDEGDCNA